MTTRRDVQESIKAYLDAQIGTGGTLAAIRKVHYDQIPIATAKGNEVLNLAGYPCLVVRDAGRTVTNRATGDVTIETWNYDVAAVAVSRDAGARRAISRLLDDYEPAILAILDGQTFGLDGVIMCLHTSSAQTEIGDLSDIVQGSQGVIGVSTIHFAVDYCSAV